MGIYLLCNGVSYSCGYSSWMVFREEIANASIRYLKKIYDEMLLTNTEQTHEQTRLEQLLEYVNVNECGTLPDYLRLFNDNDFLNLYIYYNLGGVFSLLNKSDDDGFYSIGNSVDIIETLNLLEPYFLYDDVKRQYELVKNVFKESVLSLQIVVIS